jgi:hypothetical protein
MHASFPPYTRPASAAPVSAISDTEAKLRTALAYVNHARDLLREALGDATPRELYDAKQRMDVACDPTHAHDAFARDDQATGA